MEARVLRLGLKKTSPIDRPPRVDRGSLLRFNPIALSINSANCSRVKLPVDKK
jgi:hypothetical protein